MKETGKVQNINYKVSTYQWFAETYIANMYSGEWVWFWIEHEYSLTGYSGL